MKELPMLGSQGLRYQVIDASQMIPEIGLAWTAPVPADFGPGDDVAWGKSSLLLYEDGQPLGPAHSLHEAVRLEGMGTFSHWNGALYFSSSDGEDPRNGRRYVLFPDAEAAAACPPEVLMPEGAPSSCRNGAVVGTVAVKQRRQMLLRLRTRPTDALNLILFLNRQLVYVRPGAKILDFGCGGGAMVYSLRELDFDVQGFDIHDYVDYRSDEDRKLFFFSKTGTSNTADMRFDPSSFRVPFDDQTFDMVISNSTLEHVLDIDAALSECARVLKPSGINVHCYPEKYQVVEEHIHVPLASFYSPDWWLKLWARRGVRNHFQGHLSPDQVVKSNRVYLDTALNYLSRKQMRVAARRHFNNVSIHPIWLPGDSRWAQVKQVAKALRQSNPYHAIALTNRHSAMLCDGKRQRLANAERTAASG